MSPRRSPSRGDLALAAAATARGVNVTTRQLERWRQRGWLPLRTRHSLGRGKGSASEPDPPRVLYQAMAVDGLLRQEKSAHIAAALFGQGFDIAEGHLRASFEAVINDIRTEMQARAHRSGAYIEDRSDEASAVAALGGQRRPRGLAATWKARLPLRRRPEDESWADVMYAVFDLTHAATPQEGPMLQRLLTAAGLRVASIYADLREFLVEASLDRMEEALTAATHEELVQARKSLDDILVAAIRFRLLRPKWRSIAGIDDAMLFDPLQRAVPILFVLSVLHRRDDLSDRILALA